MQLEAVREIYDAISISSFNSILVQLEDNDKARILYFSKHVFQFHIGAIRRTIEANEYEFTEEFQFHIGAIRRLQFAYCRFQKELFQFHIGAIRRPGSYL